MPRLPMPIHTYYRAHSGAWCTYGYVGPNKKKGPFSIWKASEFLFLKSFLFHLAIKKEIGFFLRPRFKIEWETIVRTNRYEAERVLLPRHNLKTQKYPFHP